MTSIPSFDSLLSRIQNHQISFEKAGSEIQNGHFSEDERMKLALVLTTPEPSVSCSKRAWNFISGAAVSCTEACASRIFKVVLQNPLHSFAAATTAIAGGIFGGPIAAVVGGVYLGGRVIAQRFFSNTAPIQRQPTDQEIEAETERVVALIKRDKAPSSKELESAVREACEYFIMSREEFLALWKEGSSINRLEMAGETLKARKDKGLENLSAKNEVINEKREEKENDSKAEKESHRETSQSSKLEERPISKQKKEINLREERMNGRKPVNSTRVITASSQASYKIQNGIVVLTSLSSSNASSSSSVTRESDRADSVFSTSFSSSSASHSSSGTEIRDGRIVRRSTPNSSSSAAHSNTHHNIHSLNDE